MHKSRLVCHALRYWRGKSAQANSQCSLSNRPLSKSELETLTLSWVLPELLFSWLRYHRSSNSPSPFPFPVCNLRRALGRKRMMKEFPTEETEAWKRRRGWGSHKHLGECSGKEIWGLFNLRPDLRIRRSGIWDLGCKGSQGFLLSSWHVLSICFPGATQR